MGYIIIMITVLVFFVFIIRHSRQFFQQIARQRIGYCLLVEKLARMANDEHDSQYYLVFQQGEQEWRVTCPLEVYLKLQPPTRGELVLSKGEFYTFEE